ncbi:hypothetical protein NECAME_03988 [Necator americanus]|uniref:Uncharacterized protein n=1 Tax=Necator americanus TaxID=51031 RepID=W2T0K2_NECAM|nr:hypothetical protein NECAME_03988 [Necator americanus]ETN74502.1 hypothetical protein NECAME_03988 [Necator americanus]
MQAKKIKYDVIGLTETRRRHPLNVVYETGEELFLGTCDNRGVGGVGVLFNTRTAKNIDSFEQLTTRIGCLRMRRPTKKKKSKLSIWTYREDHAFYKVIIGDFNPKKNAEETSHRDPRPTME